MEYSIKITARSIEEYTEIQEKIYSLPDYIRSQIESASKQLHGIECIFNNNFNTERRFNLPSYTTQIQAFDDYVGIYAGDFFFKVPKEVMKYKISYLIFKNEKINIDKAIEYVKNTQCDVHLNSPYLLLGNVVELIKILTGIKVDVETLTFKNEKNT
jgi:hypothetical protein